MDYGVSFTIYQAKMLVDHILEIIQLGELDKGSINRLEVFAKKNIPNLNPECVANFRDIRNLKPKDANTRRPPKTNANS